MNKKYITYGMLEVMPANKAVNIAANIKGSKSITNRALIFAALAKGKSVLKNYSQCDDSRIMIKALKNLGVKIKSKNKKLHVWGNNGNFKNTSKNRKTKISSENSGTATRFLIGLLATIPAEKEILFSKRMAKRPNLELINCLKKMGAKIKKNPKNRFSLKINGPLVGGTRNLDGMKSSQFLSAVLMTSPYARKKTSLHVNQINSKPYIDLTIDLMKKFGVKVKNTNKHLFSVTPQKYKKTDLAIEGDASSAVYIFSLAALTNGITTVKNISKKSLQPDLKFLKILEKMGCKISYKKNKITVQGNSELKALGDIDLNETPDSAMAAAILCLFARGKSKLMNIGQLRFKETDRLKALKKELQKIGAKVIEGEDFLEIDGDPEKLHGAVIETYHDHRIAMCFAIAGSRIKGIKIKNPQCVKKSYPGFWKDLKKWHIDWRILNVKNKIILTGLKGTGKSSIGKKLAKLIGAEFIDTDKMIEKENGQNIKMIVLQKSWDYFRNEEKKLARCLALKKNIVIAVGGGFFIHQKNFSKKNSFTVLLNCDRKILAARLRKDKNPRPPILKSQNLQDELEQLWTKRKQKYLDQADHIFNTSSESKNFKIDIEKKAEKLKNILAKKYSIHL